MTNGAPMEVKASCILLMMGIKPSMPLFPLVVPPPAMLRPYVCTLEDRNFDFLFENPLKWQVTVDTRAVDRKLRPALRLVRNQLTATLYTHREPELPDNCERSLDESRHRYNPMTKAFSTF